MGFLKKLFGGPEGIRETTRESYREHRRTANGPHALTAHERGLYGVLRSHYAAERPPRPEIQIYTELIPFLLMDEEEGVDALAELVVREELPLEARTAWLGDRIRWAIRERLPSADESLRSGAARALRQGHRPWLAFLTGTEQEVILGHAPEQE